VEGRSGRVASLAAPLAVRTRGRFVGIIALAPALLLLAHLLPTTGPGLAIRLAAAATCVLLAPGALLLRAIGWPASPGIALAGSFALSLAIDAFGLALVFAAGGSILLMGIVIASVSVVVAVPAALRNGVSPVERPERRAFTAVFASGALFSVVVWWAAGPVNGDGFFHMARARKLAELDVLNGLSSVDEFKDGGLHPGYAFPLWHAVDALVARLAGVDVADVVVYLPAILVPLALLLAYAAGNAVFRSPYGGLALAAVQLANLGLARREENLAGTGFFETVTQPQAASHLLLVPAIVALAFAFLRDGGGVALLCLSAASMGLTLVHPSYTPFIAMLLLGFLLARLVLVRTWEPLLMRAAIAVGAVTAPLILFLILFYPVISSSSSVTPSNSLRDHELANYGSLVTKLGPWFGMSPDAIARAGPVIVAGLIAIPLAAFAARRLWAALVLGGSVAVLVAVLVPPFFTIFADVFSLSQARRLPEFLPVSVAVVGACVTLSRFRGWGVAIAGGVGALLVLLYPGEFTWVYTDGGPSWAVWTGVVGGLAALVFAAWRPSWGPDPGSWALLATLAFVLPVAIAGLSRVERPGADTFLTPGMVDAVRADVSANEVVFSDRMTAYRLAAYAPVYVNASAPGHVAEVHANHVFTRTRDTRRFFWDAGISAAEREAILQRWGADWVLVNNERSHPQAFLDRFPVVYEDDRFALYDVRS
jgi:hypothetical protein